MAQHIVKRPADRDIRFDGELVVEVKRRDQGPTQPQFNAIRLYKSESGKYILQWLHLQSGAEDKPVGAQVVTGVENLVPILKSQNGNKRLDPLEKQLLEQGAEKDEGVNRVAYEDA